MGQHGKHRSLVDMRGLAALALAVLLAVPGMAQACRLALVLAIDVSSSVDAAEDGLQRRGLAAALIAPEVVSAFFASDAPVALAVYEWSGRYNQVLLQDWRLIETRRDLLEVAARVGRSQRSHDDFPTAMGYALGYGAGLLGRAPACDSQTIDMAGDGENNEGFPPSAAYREFPFAGVTVNGLVVQSDSLRPEPALLAFYRVEVLRGPGAFLEVARGFADYERAMRRKLERELRPRAVGSLERPEPATPG